MDILLNLYPSWSIYLHIAARDAEDTKLELTSPGSLSADLNARVMFTCADIKSETGVHKF
jgi:hypothetical protein